MGRVGIYDTRCVVNVRPHWQYPIAFDLKPWRELSVILQVCLNIYCYAGNEQSGKRIWQHIDQSTIDFVHDARASRNQKFNAECKHSSAPCINHQHDNDIYDNVGDNNSNGP